MKTDKIFLRGMKAQTLIGLYEWERKLPQTLVLDIEAGIAPQSAAQDDIAGTVHYGDLCEAVRESLGRQQFLLLEPLAEHVASLVLDDFGALWTKVRIVKLGILPDVVEVGIEIERSR